MGLQFASQRGENFDERGLPGLECSVHAEAVARPQPELCVGFRRPRREYANDAFCGWSAAGALQKSRL